MSMANAKQRTWGEELNTWVQTIGIILAALWGIYTFVYTQIMVPRSAPVNISLNLSLKKSGASSQITAKNGQLFEAIEMNFVAQNPSSRIIHLYPNKFIVYGIKVKFEDVNIPRELPETHENSCNYIAKHYTLSKPSVISVGDLILDVFLKPGEKVARDVIFLVPKGQYDMLQVVTRIPTSAQETNRYKLKWECTENGDLDYNMFFVSGDKETKLEKRKGGGFVNYPEELDWQYAETSSMLSLW
ncbi:MAG: hypothetical protein WAU47_07805 [Desulfobaccales bacterium]